MSVALHGSFARQFGVTIDELVVVDVDERLLAFIDATSLTPAPFPVRCVQRDLREPLPAALAGGSTRSSPTRRTRRTARGSSSPGRPRRLAGGGSSIFFSFGSRRPGVQFAAQQAIAEVGLEIRSLTRDFNDYVGAGVLGGTSHLYHLTAPAELQAGEAGLYTAARRRTGARPSTSRRRARRSGAAR